MNLKLHSASERLKLPEDHARTAISERVQYAINVDLLDEARRCRDVARGRILLSRAIENGLLSKERDAVAFLHMFARCGALQDSRNLFDMIEKKTCPALWNVMIKAYVDAGRNELALELLESMEAAATADDDDSFAPEGRTYIAALTACSNLAGKRLEQSSRWLEKGKEIHSRAARSSCIDRFVDNSLISMYAKLGKMDYAKVVFDQMIERDVISWNALLGGYIENGQNRLALEVFHTFVEEEEGACIPDGRTFLAALSACVNLTEGLEKGKAIHSCAVRSNCMDTYLASSLVRMYSKFGKMVHARELFDSIVLPDAVCWRALIAGYVDTGHSEMALKLFEALDENGCVPNERTYGAPIAACTSLELLEKGKALHSQVMMNNCNGVFTEGALLHMYAKLGKMEHAQTMFDQMPQRGIVSWNTLIQGYVENEQDEVALALFEAMIEEGVCNPDGITFTAAGTACANLGRLEKGKVIHSYAVMSNCCDRIFQNSLVHMYARCGRMANAKLVFDDLEEHDSVVWSVLIKGYIDHGQKELALEAFDVMLDAGFAPTAEILLLAAAACANLACPDLPGWLEKGKSIHSQAAAMSSSNMDVFLSSSLVHMYAQSGKIVHAQNTFDRIPEPDDACWNTMIGGFVDSGEDRSALQYSAKMDLAGVPHSHITFIALLRACGNLGWIKTGEAYVTEIQNAGLEDVMTSSIISFYGKCGSLDSAKRVFDSAEDKTAAVWTALLNAYCLQGDTGSVFRVFEQMEEQQDAAPNEVTFQCVLSACSHAGLVEQGMEIFNSMEAKYGVRPQLVHYNCVVDLLSRANLLEEALEIVTGMPCEADKVSWTALLAGCNKWGHVAIGNLAYQNLVELNTKSAPYVLMASTYSSGKGGGVPLGDGNKCSIR